MIFNKSFTTHLRLCLVLLGTFLVLNVFSQDDIGILNSTKPNSGCELANNELVTVTIFNFNVAPFSGAFDVTYEIDGVPVTENIVLGLFPATSSFTYTFATTADLSTAAIYNFKFYTTLAGDVDNSNDTLSGISIVSDTLTDPGTLFSDAVVCSGANSGKLFLGPIIGVPQYWEASITGGASWVNIVNTFDSLNYTNVTQETLYRAVVKNGYCPKDTSSVVTLTVDPTSVGGTIAGGTTVCVPPNGGAITLSGETGTILDWEFSSDGGTSWGTLSHATNTHNYLNQPSTYNYRAVVKSGVCAPTYSDTADVFVMSPAVGGTTSPDTLTVCQGANAGTIILSGSLGNISFWQSSINSGSTWSPIANTTTTQPYSNLTVETWYRAVLTTCTVDTSSISKIFIDSPSVGGSLTSSAIVCESVNSGAITLAGESGVILDWESSINGGSTWGSLSNITTTQNYASLLTTTLYRAVIVNGICTQTYSDTATITVNNASVAGVITAPTSVCASLNNDSLVASGMTGSVSDWEFSTNGGVSWTSSGVTTPSYPFTNLAVTTLFRVIVTSGVCAADTVQALITTDVPTVVGTLFQSDSICYLGSGLIYVGGQTGSITNWEQSLDAGGSWGSVGSSGDSLSYAGIPSESIFRATVKSGACASAITNNITLSIYPFNFGASNDTTIEEGLSATLIAYGGILYTWTPVTGLDSANSATTLASPIVTTTYVVAIATADGCIFQDSVVITVLPDELIIADLITANNDGFNDVWNIMGIEKYSDTKVTVFNVNGNIVFESLSYANEWDGTFEGNPLPDGTYYYLVEVVDEENIRKGFINIISE